MGSPWRGTQNFFNSIAFPFIVLVMVAQPVQKPLLVLRQCTTYGVPVPRAPKEDEACSRNGCKAPQTSLSARADDVRAEKCSIDYLVHYRFLVLGDGGETGDARGAEGDSCYRTVVVISPVPSSSVSPAGVSA